MARTYLFVVACVLAGLGGALGSIVGNAAGRTGLWAGGVLGGLLGAAAAAGVAVGRRWITRAQYWPTAIGAMLGFLAAALVAVNTLASPVGPVLSTLLVGAGAVVGARVRAAPAAAGDRPGAPGVVRDCGGLPPALANLRRDNALHESSRFARAPRRVRVRP